MDEIGTMPVTVLPLPESRIQTIAKYLNNKNLMILEMTVAKKTNEQTLLKLSLSASPDPRTEMTLRQAVESQTAQIEVAQREVENASELYFEEKSRLEANQKPTDPKEEGA